MAEIFLWIRKMENDEMVLGSKNVSAHKVVSG